MINQITLLNSIKNYLTRYQLLVKISNSENEYDINNHSENVIIPLLNIGLNGDFKNLNVDRKNFESIDLIDEVKKVGIQVTSTSNLEKIKNTLTKFLKYGHEKKINEVYIYILSEKQRSYSQEAIDKITNQKINFDVKLNILDAKDIYHKIKAINDIDIFKKVNNILEKQFSEAYITNSFTFNDFELFKNEYKTKCLTNFSRLNFFGLSVSKRPREVELYSLFVPPLFKSEETSTDFKSVFSVVNRILPESILLTNSDTKINFKKLNSITFGSKFNTGLNIDFYKDYLFHNLESSTSELPFNRLYSLPKNIVVLGNPGAGKSSMIKYSICKILENDEQVFETNSIYDFIPFRLELNKYNQSKVNKNIGFVDFLVETLGSEYQSIISKEHILKILEHFNCLIFFDGLDEIFDVQERINVRNDIENFSKTYKEARILVTSRFESYEEVKLDHTFFHKIEIKNFNEEQLTDYVNKWYKLEEDRGAERDIEVANCLTQLKLVDSELKYNPLLLSLILILYRNDLELPTNKLSIYEGCTNTIVETRDSKEKRLGISLKVGSKVAVFSALAFWQFDSQNKKINNQLVQSFIKKYLIDKEEFKDESLADLAAVEFLEFAKTRSVYFENKFTHKTFLEYFTASFIFSNFFIKLNNREKFDQILDDNLGLSSWAVVLELLICKIDASQMDSEVVESILDIQLEKNANDALLFFLQIIKYIQHITENFVLKLIERAMVNCFADSYQLKESTIDHKEVLFTYIISLYSINRFKAHIQTAFINQVTYKKLTDEQLTVFAYEFSIVANDSVLVNYLFENKKIITSPYIYIMQNHNNILKEQTYLQSLASFINLYTVKETISVFYSFFNQKIFFGSDRFNWNITFFTSAKPEKGFEQFNKLKNIGVTSQALRKSAQNKFLKESDVYGYYLILNKLPSSGYRDFLISLIKTYFPKTQDRHVDDGKFYDTFYTKYKKG